jgi:hypothetical protein
VRTRDFTFRARGTLVVIIDNGTVLNLSTLRKRRKRSKNRVILRNNKERMSIKNDVVQKAKKIAVDK